MRGNEALNAHFAHKAKLPLSLVAIQMLGSQLQHICGTGGIKKTCHVRMRLEDPQQVLGQNPVWMWCLIVIP